MITTIIGRMFLDAYNQKYSMDYSAKDFFHEVYFELFFNHSKYMQWVTNSPFVQMKGSQKQEKLTELERKGKLEEFFYKVDNEKPDASFALGYPASETKEYASTSGLVSDIHIPTDREDVYYSWIGSGLGLGVAGGYTLLIQDPEILLITFEGWKYYRNFLNDPVLSTLRGNQINTWNGQWLTYRTGGKYDPNFDFWTLESAKVFKKSTNGWEVDTVNWSNLFFGLSSQCERDILNVYIYSFGQTNKTIGFIPMYLSAGTKLKDVFKQLFHTEAAFNAIQFQSLFGMHIKRACELGNIGLYALRPASLKKYMDENKSLTFKKTEDDIIYKSYKTWLVAMLSKNKKEILDYTLDIAQLIQTYRLAAKGTERKNLIEKDLLGAKTKKAFIEALREILVGASHDDVSKIRELRDDVHLMTNEEFSYFNTLLKFDYAFVEQKS